MKNDKKEFDFRCYNKECTVDNEPRHHCMGIDCTWYKGGIECRREEIINKEIK